MVRNLDDSNLLLTLKTNHNFKAMEFEMFRISQYVANFQIFKSLLPHVNGCNVHDI
jgi:hypothetical protein